jgi:hypothetical protein
MAAVAPSRPRRDGADGGVWARRIPGISGIPALAWACAAGLGMVCAPRVCALLSHGRMHISMGLWLAAMLAMLNLLGTGCAGPDWPRVRSQADHGFLSRHVDVRTIDILPTDMEVWSHPGERYALPELAEDLDAVVSGAATATLARRGYQIMAHMDWGGMYVAPDGSLRQGMPVEQVESTIYALSGYAHAVAQAERGLLVPYLPHRLGMHTGSDATLYIGGWAYVGEDPTETTGKKVAQGVAIGILVVALVVVVVLLLEKGGGGGGGKAASAAGRASTGMGRAVSHVAVTAGRSMGRAVVPLMRGAARASAQLARGMLHAADAFGRSNTHIHIYAGRPSYYEHAHTPKRGPSRMHVEMTLVDNRTGLVLWHAQDTFPAHPPRNQDVHKVFEHMLAGLPAQ